MPPVPGEGAGGTIVTSNLLLLVIFLHCVYAYRGQRSISVSFLLPNFNFCFCFCFVLFCFVFQDRVSLCSPGCPGTHSVDQAGLELRNPPASAYMVALEMSPSHMQGSSSITDFHPRHRNTLSAIHCHHYNPTNSIGEKHCPFPRRRDCVGCMSIMQH